MTLDLHVAFCHLSLAGARLDSSARVIPGSIFHVRPDLLRFNQRLAPTRFTYVGALSNGKNNGWIILIQPVFKGEFHVLCMHRQKVEGILIRGSVVSAPKAQIPEPALLAGEWRILVFNSNLSFLFPKGGQKVCESCV